MIRKKIAIILETIPLVAAPVSYLLLRSPFNSDIIRTILTILFPLAFFGFAFFIAGRKLAKESRAVRILGAFDWAATAYVIVFYAIVIFTFGL